MNKTEQAVLDPIAAIMQKIEADPRANLINLCFGYYQSEGSRTTGFTVLEEVVSASATAQKVEMEIAGPNCFRKAVASMLTQDRPMQHDFRVVQTIGATGGLWLNFELLYRHDIDQKIWFSAPGWGNLYEIARNVGIESGSYRYEPDSTGALNFAILMEDLGKVEADDIVVIQGCCHNPTGLDLTQDQLHALSTLLAGKKAAIIIDFAYFGLRDGVESDSRAIATVAEVMDEFFVVNSFSKNLGLYNDRLGALSFFSRLPGRAIELESKAKKRVRATYSMPPVAMARKVALMLNDVKLRAKWYREIEHLSDMLHQRREALKKQLAAVGLYSLIKNPYGRGMFINLNLLPHDISRLALEDGIYLLPDGRISIASLQLAEVAPLVTALSILFAENKSPNV